MCGVVNDDDDDDDDDDNNNAEVERKKIYDEWEKNRFTGEVWEWEKRGTTGKHQARQVAKL